MADTEQENILGLTDKRRTQNQVRMPGNLGLDARYMNVADLRGALVGRGGALYTAKYLDGMTKNDMVYALRLIDDAAGF